MITMKSFSYQNDTIILYIISKLLSIFHNCLNSTSLLFLYAEIIKEVETNGDKLTELLRNGADQLEPNCLNRALIAATRNDNHHNIGKLIVKGADNLEECMDIAIRERKPQSRAMLLLVKAGITGNKSIIQKLFGDPVSNPQSLDPRELMDDQFADVQEAVLSGKVSTVAPIEISRRNGNGQVREELLIKTDVNQEEGSVFWHGLRLFSLDISWLRRIPWVKRLRLASNGFKSLPPEMGTYLKQVYGHHFIMIKHVH